jgi:hypothetical protein
LRKFWILAGLITLALALYGLNRLAADWHYVVPAKPDTVLYAATFDAFLDDWDLYEGRLSAQVEDGALVIEVGAVDSLPFSTAAPYFHDFDVSVQAQAVDGPLNNGFGVIFRLRDPRNYYLFLVSSDGYYRVVREVDGVQRELSTWIPLPAVNQGIGEVNHLRVTASGEAFRFYINGEPVQLCIPDNPEGYSTFNDITGECQEGRMVDILVDDSLPYGRLGVIAMTLDEPDVRVAFDNLVVYGPGSAALPLTPAG